MTDIVERLRDLASDLMDWGAPYAAHAAQVREAADEIERLRAALENLTEDPPATLAREPDTDDEVIIKMRAIARAALEHR